MRQQSGASGGSPDDSGIQDSPFVLQIPDMAPRYSNEGFSKLGDTIVEHSYEPIIGANIDEEDPLQSRQYSSPILVRKSPQRKIVRKPRKPRQMQHSRFGIAYPAVPTGVTKSVANTFARTLTGQKSKLSKDVINAIKEAGDLFLTQLGGDLSMFARHAGRKVVDDSDVIAAMMRYVPVSVH